MARVIVVGSINVDRVTHLDRLPAPGETVLSITTLVRPGGKGANQAAAAASLGADVSLVGRVGADDCGARYRRALAERGVGVSNLACDQEAPTGTAQIFVDRLGENMIVVDPGANGRMSPADVDAAHIGAGDIVLLQLEIPMATVEYAIDEAFSFGATVVLNASPYSRMEPKTLSKCSIVVVNEVEAAQIPGLVDREQMVVTAGGAGARWGELRMPARAARVVDTTGAGDAFAGALTAALSMGGNRMDALAAAVECAGNAVTHEGAQDWTL